MRSPLLLSLLCALGHPLPACGHGCPSIARPSLVITVIDARTGEHICDAEVVVTHGDYSASLTVYSWGADGSGDCSYQGPSERPGMYTVRVSKPGYATATRSGLRVTEDQCNVRTLSVTIPLGR